MEIFNLPEEIQVEIFLKLPTKSISISRCVCKIWYAILSNNIFVNSLLIRPNNNPRLMLFKVPQEICRKPIDLVYSIDYGSVLTMPTTNEYCQSNGVAIQMDYPFHKEKVFTYRVVGSCNGLFCIITSGNTISFWIWNPTTREYKKISRRPYESPVELFRYGFGHDSETDDYKMVIIFRYKNSPDCFRALLYTLESDSWKFINSPISYWFGRPCGFWYDRDCGLLFHGALHWIGKSQENAPDVIVSFDISTETFAYVPLLEETYPKESDKHVGVLGDCLCLAVAVEDTRFDVWVMRDYGVGESWTKKFTITHYTTRRSFFKPIWCFDNGEILIESVEDLMLYDQTNGRVRIVNFPINTGKRNRRSVLLLNGENYVESLVSLRSGTYVEKIPTTPNTEKPVSKLVIFLL